MYTHLCWTIILCACASLWLRLCTGTLSMFYCRYTGVLQFKRDVYVLFNWTFFLFSSTEQEIKKNMVLVHVLRQVCKLEQHMWTFLPILYSVPFIFRLFLLTLPSQYMVYLQNWLVATQKQKVDTFHVLL